VPLSPFHDTATSSIYTLSLHDALPILNAAVTEILEGVNTNHNTDLEDMVATSIKVREIIGFENYGVPFCMTYEAEPFGVVISERSEEHTSELQSRFDLVCRLLLEKKRA